MNFLNEASAEDELIDINITPLIDIVFLLLIFFMVSTTFIESHGVKVDLPKTSQNASQAPAEDITITVKKDGTIYFEDKLVSEERLRTIFTEALTKERKTTLVVRADGAATHGGVVALMDLAKRSGIEKIAIATAPASKTKP